MYVSDFKSAPFDVYNGGNNGNPNFSGTPTPVPNGYRGTGLNGIPDYSYDALLNSKWATEDGRILTLMSNNYYHREPGRLMAADFEDTNFQDLAITVPAAYPATEGTFQVLVTSASVVNFNYFAGGNLVVSSGTGAGQTLKIASHENAASGNTFVVTLEDPIQITLDVTSTVTLMQNPAKFAHYTNTSPNSCPLGVALYQIPASEVPTYDNTTGALVTAGVPQYAFVVSHGPVGCFVDDDLAVGSSLGQSTGSNGFLGVASLTESPIAIAMQTTYTDEACLVYMML